MKRFALTLTLAALTQVLTGCGASPVLEAVAAAVASPPPPAPAAAPATEGATLSGDARD